MEAIIFGLLIFISTIVTAGFNKLFSIESRINTMIKDSQIRTDILKHEFLISSGWIQSKNGLYSNKIHSDWELNDAFQIEKMK